MSPVLGGNSASKQTSVRKGETSGLDVGDEANDLEMIDAVSTSSTSLYFTSRHLTSRFNLYFTKILQDDAVVEYDFSNDADRGEDEDDGRDTMWYKKSNKITEDVITISSDDDKDEKSNEEAECGLGVGVLLFHADCGSKSRSEWRAFGADQRGRITW